MIIILALLEQKNKTFEHKDDSDTNCTWCSLNNLQRIGKGIRKLKNRIISQDHPDYNLIKIGQNTEKSLEETAVTQNHLVTLTWKTLKRVKKK